MIAGELPEAAPETPVDVWMWTFFKSIRTVRDISFDAAAKLMRVDCRERTLQSQRVELCQSARNFAPLSAPNNDPAWSARVAGPMRCSLHTAQPDRASGVSVIPAS